MTPPKLDGVLDDEAWSAGPQALDPWMSYNPLRGQQELLQTQVWIAYDDKATLLRVQVPRPGARQDPHHDQPARQRVERRLGGREPRFEPRRPDGVPHVHQPERHPDGCAPERATRTRPSIGLAERRPRGRGGLHRRDTAAAAEHPVPRRAGRAHGRAVLPPQQPPRHVVVVAGDGADGEWVFENHAQVAFGELHQPLLLEVIPSATLSRATSRVRWGRQLAERRDRRRTSAPA